MTDCYINDEVQFDGYRSARVDIIILLVSQLVIVEYNGSFTSNLVTFSMINHFVNIIYTKVIYR